MDDYENLKHTRWECKYHIVFIPKCRRKKLYEQLRQHLGEVFRQLAQQRECKILEGHLIVDHVHLLISIPPKYAVAQVIGYIKDKSVIHIAHDLQDVHVVRQAGLLIALTEEAEQVLGLCPVQRQVAELIHNDQIAPSCMSRSSRWLLPPHCTCS